MQTYINELMSRGEIRIVDREVDPEHELAAVVSKSQKESDLPILFRNVKGTKFPVISNVYGSRSRICDMIGAGRDDFCKRWVEITDGAYEQDNLFEEVPEPDNLIDGRISDLPHITYHKKDAGPYITAGVFLAKDPETGVPNLSFCRSKMVSDEELRVRMGDPHDITAYQAKAEAKGEALEVAILIGSPNSVFLAACASIPREESELELAAKIEGQPIKMRPCKTIDLMVPAETAIVIEGRVLPNVRKPEGPFGEFMGTYTPEGNNHVFEVTRVTWQEGAMYHGLLCGSPDDLQPLNISFATRVYRSLKNDLPGIIDVNCHPVLHNTIVKIDKQSEDHSKQVMLKTFGAHLNYNKVCVVVDHDVDIHDFDDVWWAFVYRGRADTRIWAIEDIPAFYWDPGKIHSGRLGIDATLPLRLRDDPEFERKTILGIDDINISDYLSKG